MDAHTARENAASGRAKERKWNVLNEHEGGVILSGTVDDIANCPQSDQFICLQVA
jgi:hypothetical protein